jgi:hypothetical protein
MMGAALLASAVVAGCSDRATTAPVAPTSPAASAPASNSLLGGLLGGVVGVVGKLLNIVVTLVERPVALNQDVVWSFDAGPNGALSGNRATGLSIAIPPGALDHNVHITVTARAGKVYDYHFEPEGLQFAVPVVLTQTLPSSAFKDGGLTLKGAYYSAPTLQYDATTGQATVNEIQPTVVDAWHNQISFSLRHFSEYVVASCMRE